MTLAHHFPSTPALSHGHTGVPFRRLLTKAGLHTGQKFSCQRNFRQQDQGLTPLPQTGRHRFKVDFGLAGAGHTFQQGGVVTLPIALQICHGGRLIL